jgi:hypothetical protein
MILKEQLKEGDYLIAIDTCTMEEDGTEALTINNKYRIEGFSTIMYNNHIWITDDNNDMHYFPINELHRFFKI